MTERAFVTGGRGFLGQHLVARLRADGVPTTVYDRQQGEDVLDGERVEQALVDSGATRVYHLAALADVRLSFPQVMEQRRQNFESTALLLEAMQQADVRQIVFTSSAVVYGDAAPGLLSEQAPMPRQTSVYGAMKLASEALIEAYAAAGGVQADIFRLVSVVGTGYRHGNLWDFYRRLKADPTRIHLLGTGREQKYYIDADDLMDGIRRAVATDHPGAEVWNVSSDTPVRIDEVLDVVCGVLQVQPERTYAETTWTGDLPGLVLDTAKLRALGWTPATPILQTMEQTVASFDAVPA